MPLLKTQPTQGGSIKRRVFSWPTLLSYGVAIALIGLLILRFDLDWGETWQSIKSINPWLYGLAILAYYVSFVFRGARWRILARNAESRHSELTRLPSTTSASTLIVIGWFVNSVAWLRLGDAYRAYAFSEDTGASFSWSLGTLLAERLLDMITVAALIVVSVLLLTFTSGLVASGYIVIAAILMAVLIALVVIAMRFYGTRLARFLPSRLEESYDRFQQGTLGSLHHLPTVLTLGFIGWLLEMARLYLVVQALGIDVGLALIPVVALAHAIFSTVPTPGGIGVVEPGLTGLLLLELSRPDAVAVALTDRSITYLSVVFIGGLLFLARQLVRARKAREVDSQASSGTGIA